MDTPAEVTPKPTNGMIGALIGMGQTGISRIRTGDRLPSISAMRRIERGLDWSCESQIEFRERGQDAYAQEFNRRCSERIALLSGSGLPPESE